MSVKKVYIETKGSDGVFLNHNIFLAWDGFRKRGIETEFFNYEKLSSGYLFLTKETLVVGNINSVTKAFKQLKVKQPEIIDIPKSIEKFANRKIWTTTLGEIRNMKTLPVFIKPLKNQKLFTGYVIREYKDLIKTAYLEDELELLAQEVVNIHSEWRHYVFEGKIIHTSCYSGDPLLFPNPDIVRSICDNWKNKPVACSIDVGVNSKDNPWNDTFLIECNDMFSLGAYGNLDSTLYSKALESRWNEIVNQ